MHVGCHRQNGNACKGPHKFKNVVLENLPNLKGLAPPEITLISSLEELELSNCNLEAPLLTVIPEQMMTLADLVVLKFNNDGLFGDLTTCLGNLTSLQVLCLHSNGISGSLPTIFGQMESLHELQLDENNPNGEAPSELSRLNGSLTLLLLNDNKLTGSTPTELASMMALSELKLNDNDTSGMIPTHPCGCDELVEAAVAE